MHTNILGLTLLIDRIVQRESSNREFGSGWYRAIKLPATAPVEALLAQAFKNTLPYPTHPGSMHVISKREVKISTLTYTAILVDTEDGRKIVFLHYDEPVHDWWSRVYDE
jgi:hypothetical protein